MSWRDRPNAPACGTTLARVEDIPADNGLERVFGDGPSRFRVVLFRTGGGVRAYVNECPHFHVPFNFREGEFCVYDFDGQRDLMCAHHTAMFHLDDGACYEGPCMGGRLEAVDVEDRDGVLRIGPG